MGLQLNHMARPNTVSSNERGMAVLGWRLLSIIAIECFFCKLFWLYILPWVNDFTPMRIVKFVSAAGKISNPVAVTLLPSTTCILKT